MLLINTFEVEDIGRNMKPQKQLETLEEQSNFTIIFRSLFIHLIRDEFGKRNRCFCSQSYCFRFNPFYH